MTVSKLLSSALAGLLVLCAIPANAGPIVFTYTGQVTDDAINGCGGLVTGSSRRADAMASGESQSTPALPYLSPKCSPMFCALPLKYCGAASIVISSRSQPWRMGRFDRCGTGTGENPF